MSSRSCPLKLQASIATQSQLLLDMEVATRQLEQPEQPEQLPKQLSPDRPEVLMQAYPAEKAAWLAQHPTVRPAEYRKARKWKTPRPKVLKEQAFYMPRERRGLTSTIIANKANWIP
jgi:hypothetical protein